MPTTIALPDGPVATFLDDGEQQITNMPAGTRALFAHFVSSGWIYFLVTGEGGDRLVASDAALRVAAANP